VIAIIGVEMAESASSFRDASPIPAACAPVASAAPLSDPSAASSSSSGNRGRGCASGVAPTRGGDILARKGGSTGRSGATGKLAGFRHPHFGSVITTGGLRPAEAGALGVSEGALVRGDAEARATK